MTTEARPSDAPVGAKPRVKITYATLRNDNEELHALYEQGVQEARAGLGGHHQNYIGGRWVDGSGGTFEARSPIDRDLVIGTFAKGDRDDVKQAIEAARRSCPSGAGRPGRSAWRSCARPRSSSRSG